MVFEPCRIIFFLQHATEEIGIHGQNGLEAPLTFLSCVSDFDFPI